MPIFHVTQLKIAVLAGNCILQDLKVTNAQYNTVKFVLNKILVINVWTIVGLVIMSSPTFKDAKSVSNKTVYNVLIILVNVITANKVMQFMNLLVNVHSHQF